MLLLLSLLPGPDARCDKVSFLAQFALVLAAVKVAGHLSRRLGQPSVFGKLLVDYTGTVHGHGAGLSHNDLGDPAFIESRVQV